METINDRSEEYNLRPGHAGNKYIEGQSPACPCPKCGTKAHARTTERLSKFVGKLYYRCFNPRCAMRFTAHLEIVGVTQESMLGTLEGTVPFLNLKPKAPPAPPDMRPA